MVNIASTALLLNVVLTCHCAVTTVLPSAGHETSSLLLFFHSSSWLFFATSVASGSSPTWTTPFWMTLCPESMCYICGPAVHCSSSSRTSGSSLASPAARTRLTTSSPTSPSASSSWSVSALFCVCVCVIILPMPIQRELFLLFTHHSYHITILGHISAIPKPIFRGVFL